MQWTVGISNKSSLENLFHLILKSFLFIKIKCERLSNKLSIISPQIESQKNTFFLTSTTISLEKKPSEILRGYCRIIGQNCLNARDCQAEKKYYKIVQKKRREGVALIKIHMRSFFFKKNEKQIKGERKDQKQDNIYRGYEQKIKRS